jgi:hypothetical protein
MNRMRLRWLAVVFLFLVVIGWAMGQYDYTNLEDGKRPLFARVRLDLADGGSIQYLGLGYTVTDHHQLWTMEPQTNAPWQPVQNTQFRVGPTLDYWTPFMSREDLSFVVETN